MPQVKNTALIAISTPLDTSNFYSNLINMKADNGTPVFEVLQASAACDKCIKELDDPSKCPHINLERPLWKSKEKQQIVKALYNNNKAMMLRESMGVVTETANGVFLRKTVDDMFEKPRRTLKDVSHVYVAIDPTGAGPSKFAIVSVVRRDGAAIIVGMDNAKIRTHEDMRNIVVAHLNKLKIMFELLKMDPWYLFMIESNLGMEAAHIAHVVKDYKKTFVLRETGKEGRHGVLTTHMRKMEFVAITEQMLNTSAISFSVDVCTSQSCVKELMKELKEQLYHYRKVNSEVNSSNAFGAQKITYSGKVSEDGKLMPYNMQDDLCITLQLALFWSTYVLQRKCCFLDYNLLF